MTPPHLRLAARNDNVSRDATPGEALIDCARLTPHRAALTDSGRPGAPPRTWTCEALRDDAATLAGALLSRFAPGERIAVWAPASPEAVLLRFAAAFAGLVLVEADAVCGPADLARIVDLSGAVGVFVTSGGRRQGLGPAAAETMPGVREIVDLADRRALFAKRRCVEGLPEVRPGDPAMIRYGAAGGDGFSAETLTQRDLAESLRGALAGPGRDAPADRRAAG